MTEHDEREQERGIKTPTSLGLIALNRILDALLAAAVIAIVASIA